MTARLDPAERERLLAFLAEAEGVEDRRTFRRIDFFEPYAKQLEFIALGATKRERLLMAANQVGKSEIGAYETAVHLTGLYPADWQGRVWKRPTKGWAAGETTVLTRDVQQKKLCGEPGVEALFGTGMIPKELFVGAPTRLRGATDAFDTIQVKNVSGGLDDSAISVLRFKSYEQGRTKFQGETLDFAWCDEEPPLVVYSEILTRITATQGMVSVTFTPLKGPTGVVLRFTDERSPDRSMVTMTIDDARHISDTERKKIIAGYLPHEREARAKGVPALGEGRVFLATEEEISEPAINPAHVPVQWKKLWSIDFGIGHPFAATLILYDADYDVIHVHATVKLVNSLVIQHAQALKVVGAEVPVAWPHDGAARDPKSGEPLSKIYKDYGLRMLPQHATWPDGGYSTEAGIIEMDERMRSGRLKIASHLSDWFEEYRMYHRKNGLIVKFKDDLMSATRVGVMAKRFAKNVTLGGRWVRDSGGPRKSDAFDIFTGAPI